MSGFRGPNGRSGWQRLFAAFRCSRSAARLYRRRCDPRTTLSRVGFRGLTRERPFLNGRPLDLKSATDGLRLLLAVESAESCRSAATPRASRERPLSPAKSSAANGRTLNCTDHSIRNRDRRKGRTATFDDPTLAFRLDGRRPARSGPPGDPRHNTESRHSTY